MSAANGRLGSVCAREPAREILPEQRGALRKARDYVATVVNDRTLFGWTAVGAILVGCWFIRGISKDIESVAVGLADARSEMRDGFASVNARMAFLVTREQADDLVARRIAEARLAPK